MKKLIPALLIATPLLIAGCSQSNSNEMKKNSITYKEDTHNVLQ